MIKLNRYLVPIRSACILSVVTLCNAMKKTGPAALRVLNAILKEYARPYL
jgi:hypothetical protein